MQTYTTVEGDVLDLRRLSARETVHLEDCYEAFKQGMASIDFQLLVFGAKNPFLAEGNVVTREIFGSTLFRAIRDLLDRLEIREGMLGTGEDNDVDRDPFSDELVAVADVAAERGVTVTAVYQAIERGSIIATDERPRRVSRNSLERWHIQEVRQRAGKARARIALSR